MTKLERYYALRRTKAELEIPITIVFCSSDGPKTPYRQSVKEQKYDVEFSSGGRGLLIAEEVVEFALKENLGALKDSMRYYVRQNLEKAHKEAVQDAENKLANIKRQTLNNDNNPK